MPGGDRIRQGHAGPAGLEVVGVALPGVATPGWINSALRADQTHGSPISAAGPSNAINYGES
jgi:hypothetical protein